MSKKFTKRELANLCRKIANGWYNDAEYREYEDVSGFLWSYVDDELMRNGAPRGTRSLVPISDRRKPEVQKAWRKLAHDLDHGLKVEYGYVGVP